jgi:hypothetical protein
VSKLLHYLVRPICPKRMVIKEDFRHLNEFQKSRIRVPFGGNSGSKSQKED